MKRKFLLVLIVAFATFLGANAQQQLDERYGADPAQRENNARMVQYMKNSYATKMYDDALGYLRQLLVNAPKSSHNMYIWGTEIYRGKLAKAETKAEKTAYLDTILALYDKRIENFGDHEQYGSPYLTAQKALIYSEENPADHKKAFELFRVAIKTGGKDVDPSIVTTFFSLLTDAFKLDDISPEDYIAEYESLSAILAGIEGEAATQTVGAVEALFAASGAASCENIERIFRPKYEADPENADLVKKILGLFSRSKCSSEFQLALTENYYKMDPTPELAAMLAGIYEGKKDYAKALEYSKVAIAGEKDPVRKMAYVLGAANSQYNLGNYRETAELARQAIAIDDAKAGIAYLLLAEAYAGGVKSCSGFDRQAAYWLVVDTYNQAKSRLQDQPDQVEQINKLVGSYSASFPDDNAIFFRDLTKGQGYTVNCGWVSGRTTIR